MKISLKKPMKFAICTLNSLANIIIVIIIKNNLTKYYGLTSISKVKEFLYFIPLIILIFSNLFCSNFYLSKIHHFYDSIVVIYICHSIYLIFVMLLLCLFHVLQNLRQILIIFCSYFHLKKTSGTSFSIRIVSSWFL